MRSNSEIRLVEGHPTAEHDDGEPPRIDPIASRQAQLISGRKQRCPEHHPCPRDREGRIHRDRRRSSRRIQRRTAGGSIRLGRRSVAVAVAASAAASSYLSATIIFAAVVTWTSSLANAAHASSSAPVAEVAVRCPPSRKQSPQLTRMLSRSPSLDVRSHLPNHRRRVNRIDHRAIGDPPLFLRGGGDDEESSPKSSPRPPSSAVANVGVDTSISTTVGGEGREAPEMMTTPFDDQYGRNVDTEPLPEDGGWEGTGTPSSERTSSSVLLTTPHRWMPAMSVALREVVVGDHHKDREETETTATVTMATAEPVLVTKFELSRRLGCPLRDLRIVDPKYGGATAVVGPGPSPSSSTSSVRAAVVATGPRQHSNTAFLPRRGGVVVHVGAARAVVMEREVLLFGTTGGAGTGTDVVDVDGLVGFLLDHLNSVFGEAGNAAEPQEEGGGGRKGGSGRRGATTSSSRQQPSQRHAHDYRKRAQKPPGGERAPPPPPPFELVVIEAILSYVCTEEAERAASVIETAREVLDGIEGGGGRNDSDDTTPKSRKKNKRAKKASFMSMQSRLGQLLPLKNRLDELEANCAEVSSAIVDVLRSDEDMEAMVPSRSRSRLLEGGADAGRADARRVDPTVHHHHGAGAAVRSDYPHHTTTHHHHGRRDTVRHPPLLPPPTTGGHAEEVELLFEDSLLRMEEVLYSLRSVQSAVRNTEEVVEIELDVMRNRILRYELLLESSGLAVGCGAAITGLFGMNLVSHYEDHAKMFYYVTAFIVVLMAGIGFGIVSQLEIYNIW